MKSYYSFLIYFLILILIACINTKLVGVVEIIRHGSRAPPYFSQSGEKLFFDSSKMMLTINGFRQHFLLGKWLRERYVGNFKLLPVKFNKNDFLLYSTATERTIFSLTGHMSGFYPGVNIVPEYNELKSLKFDQSPPINRFKIKDEKKNEIKVSVNNKVGPMIHSWKCKYNKKVLSDSVTKKNLFNFNEKTLDMMIETFKKHLHFIFTDKKNKLILQALAKNKVLLVKKLIGYATCSKFLSENSYFKFSKNFDHLMRIFIVDKWYNYRFGEHNDNLLKLANSPFFEELKNYLSSLLKGDNRKFVIYSGHDSNIVNIITNLIDHNHLKHLIEQVIKNDDPHAFNFLIPKFASNILFEVHQNKRKLHFIKILYNGVEIKKNFISKKLKYDPENGISIKNFIEFLGERINPDFKKLECD